MSERLTRRILAQEIALPDTGFATRMAWRLRGDLNKTLQLGLRWPDLGRVRSSFSWRRIKSCNLAVWRSDLERVNGFDESFTGWGHEDSDLVVRLFHAGVKRKDGAFATEVFHLWHREAQRDQESSNRSVVLARAEAKITQATIGLREHPGA
jgi:GT2 family glycosyltransferase